MALQKINWTQIDSITVPSGYTVDIGKIDGPIDAIYSEKIYLSGVSIGDLYLNSGSFSQGVLTLTSNSGNTITVTGFEYDFDRYTTGFTYNDNNTFTIVDRSGYTLTASFNILTGLTINGDLKVNGNTNLSGGFTATTISATTISGGTFYGDGSNLTNIDNIYTVDGSLQSNRIVDLSGNTLSLRRTSNISDSLLNGLDISGNTLFEIRSHYRITRPPTVFPFDPFPNTPTASIFIGLNSGKNSIVNSITGNGNTALGSNSLSGLTTGTNNTAIGSFTLTSLTGSSFNIAIGEVVAPRFVGGTGGTGDDNIFIGNAAALQQTTGRNNIIIGTNAYQNNLSGDNNTIIGKNAGINTTNSKSGNVFIGFSSGMFESGSNLLYIDNSSTSTPLIWGDFTNDYLRFNAKVGVNVLNSTYQFDVNGTSRFSNTVQLDTVNLGLNDVKILTLNTGNTIQYRDISDVLNTVTADTYVTGFTYLNNTFTIKDNSGNTFNTTIDVMTGLTVNGDLTVTGNTNLNGLSLNNLSANTISTTTISGGTFYGNGGNLTNIVLSVSGGTGLSGNSTTGNVVLINTSPDQVVTISGGTGILTGGTYPNFTITNTLPDQTVTISVGTGLEITGSYPNFGINFTGQTNFPYLQTTGGTVTGDTIFQSGLTANTIYATTYENLPIDPNTYLTGFTYNDNKLSLSDNSGNTFNVTIDQFTGLTINGTISATTISGGTFYGVGSNKQVIYNNNGILDGDNDFVYDGTNVGIGTFSPTNLLHITGSTDPVRIQGLQPSTGNTVVIIENDGVLKYGDIQKLTGDKWVSGGSFDNRYNILYLGYNTGGGFRVFLNITGSTAVGDTYITGGTYNQTTGTATFVNNSGGTFTVSGFYTGGTLSGDYLPLSGGTVTGDVIFQSGITANTIYATTYQNLPLNVYGTGLTFNTTNYNLTLDGGNGTLDTIDLSILATDLLVTGGTYNNNTGIATFTNNSGGTFDVSGFLIGYTDTIITAFTYSNNTFTINDSSGNTFTTIINQVTGFTVNGNLTVTGNTNLNALNLNTLNADTISATTISGGTFYGDGSGLTNVQNIYNNDGFLSANRTLNLNGNSLTIQGTSSSRFFANGRLGIGTTTDGGFDFDVNGTSRLNNDTIFGSTRTYFNLANSRIFFRGTATSGFGLSFNPTNVINTANQNISAVSIMDNLFGQVNYTVGTNTFNNLGITPVINTVGGTNLVRGVYFAPTISGLTGTTIIGFENTVGNNLFNSISGNTGIGLSGTPTNKLHVSATTDPVRFEGLQLSNTDTRILTSDNNGVIEYRNFSDFNVGGYLPLSGGTVTGGTNFNSGLSSNTISATTISGGTLYGDGSNLTNVDNLYNIDGILQSNRTVSTTSGYTLTINPQTTFSPSITSVTITTATTIGTRFNPSLFASISGNTLIGLDISPTYTNSPHTNVTNIDLRTKNAGVVIGSNYGYGSLYGNSNDGIVEISDEGSLKTRMTFRPAGNSGGYNGNWWSRIEQDGYKFRIYSGNYPTGQLSGQWLVGGPADNDSTFGAFFNNNGNIVVGSTTDSGLKLDSYGVTRIQSDFGVGTFSTPSVPTLSGITTSGSITGETTGTTYVYRIVGVDNLGYTTPAGTTSSISLSGSTNSVIVTWTTITGITSYRVYRTNPWNGTNRYFVATTNTFTDTGEVPTCNGCNPPTQNQTLRTNISSTGNIYVNGTATITGKLTLYDNSLSNTPIVIKGGSSDSSIFIGGSALANNNTTRNVIIDPIATYTNLTGGGNTIVGRMGSSLTTGSQNVMIGNHGAQVTTGRYNVFLGQHNGETFSFNTATSGIIFLSCGVAGIEGTAKALPSETSGWSFLGGWQSGISTNKFYFGASPFLNHVFSSSISDIDFFAPSGLGTNFYGGNFRINAGRGTGNASGGNIIFSTSSSLSSGSTLQTLSERVIITSSGNTLIGTTVDSGNKLFVSGSTNPVRFEGLQSGNTDTRILTSDSNGVIRYRNLDSITGINTYTTTGITVSSQTLTTSISYYGVSYSGNVNLTLPSPINNDGASIIIKDEGGYSGTYRIRLIPPTGTIDGGSYADMNINYISLTLIARNNNWWII